MIIVLFVYQRKPEIDISIKKMYVENHVDKPHNIWCCPYWKNSHAENYAVKTIWKWYGEITLWIKSTYMRSNKFNNIEESIVTILLSNITKYCLRFFHTFSLNSTTYVRSVPKKVSLAVPCSKNGTESGYRSCNFERNFLLFTFHSMISRELFHESLCDY